MNWDEMTETERNELVAEKVMGLVRGVNFGKWDEHQWILDEDGEVDVWAFDGDYHNGPACRRCSYSYCEHCQDGPDEPCELNAPSYSTSMMQAWKVFKHLGWQGSVSYQGEAVACHIAGGVGENAIQGQANSDDDRVSTMQGAICLAALRAVGVEI